MKRTFDIVMAAIGLIAAAPLFLVIAAIVKLDSNGGIFFRQERIGRHFRPFRIYKFRTMSDRGTQQGSLITYGNDSRITRVGRLLRKTKLDELPQLINVLNGDMSFVGPRPEVPKYVERFHNDYREILAVRPGITDLASLKYRDEAALLGKAIDPEEEYLRRVLPDKIQMAKDYLRRASFLFDLSVILRTIFGIFDYRTFR